MQLSRKRSGAHKDLRSSAKGERNSGVTGAIVVRAISREMYKGKGGRGNLARRGGGGGRCPPAREKLRLAVQIFTAKKINRYVVPSILRKEQSRGKRRKNEGPLSVQKSPYVDAKLAVRPFFLSTISRSVKKGHGGRCEEEGETASGWFGVTR